MSEGTANVICMLGVVAMTCCILGVSLPMHRAVLSAANADRAFSMETYLMKVAVEPSAQFCEYMETRKSGFCNRLAGKHGLRDAAQSFCADSVESLFPGFCNGLRDGYLSSLMLVGSNMVNVCAVGTACFWLQCHLTFSQKRMHRVVTLSILGAATLVDACALVSYALLALAHLDDARVAGGADSVEFARSRSRSTGVSIGYAMLWLGAFTQAGMLAMYARAGVALDVEHWQEVLEGLFGGPAARDIGDAPGEAPGEGGVQGGIQGSAQGYGSTQSSAVPVGLAHEEGPLPEVIAPSPRLTA